MPGSSASSLRMRLVFQPRGSSPVSLVSTTHSDRKRRTPAPLTHRTLPLSLPSPLASPRSNRAMAASASQLLSRFVVFLRPLMPALLFPTHRALCLLLLSPSRDRVVQTLCLLSRRGVAMSTPPRRLFSFPRCRRTTRSLASESKAPKCFPRALSDSLRRNFSRNTPVPPRRLPPRPRPLPTPLVCLVGLLRLRQVLPPLHPGPLRCRQRKMKR
ncbi:hypothetical protein TGRUB_272390A [Toxoplasma gondii RUB]|uniref:Uncharacterized protein n=1 Tax=Toxoplasma gondii RUB TaxID=935652 RepID=A0A086M5G1_TOXGO|nr:hypothetical protein TGRUB_272390A [Toxoplasma gondii RUB]